MNFAIYYFADADLHLIFGNRIVSMKRRIFAGVKHKNRNNSDNSDKYNKN